MNLHDTLGSPVVDAPDPPSLPPQTCAATRQPPAVPPAASSHRTGLRIAVAALGAVLLVLAGWWLRAAQRPAGDITTTMPPAIEPLPAPVAGIAEVFTALYLSGNATAVDLASRNAGDPVPASGLWVNDATAIAGTPTRDGVWEVTVVVDSLERVDGSYTAAPLSYYTVPVTTVPDRPVVLAPPARVPSPPAPAAVPTHTVPVPSDQAAVATAFVEDYLTINAAIDGLLAPNADVDLFARPPYESVAAVAVGASEQGEILVTATATTAAGAVHRLGYVVALTTDAGRWRVEQMGWSDG